MAQVVAPPVNDRKRVKVYELKSNDWFDRGTGFCTGQVLNQDEARLFVQSEDEPTRTLLDTRISRDDGYQKQQDTLIVWTEPNGTDMALSFQEAEGCAAIWDFVAEVQQRLSAQVGPDDGLSDDVMDGLHAIGLPSPELGNLPEVENIIRGANTTANGRDALAKFIVGADYIAKLVPLVEMAEDLESLPDLHRLCNIMKTLILLNDTAIIEYVVTDDVVLGVVGALEYDPDFPCHKANHRLYLSNDSRFKEVVKIEDINIKKKIHYTYRLQYLKDVVLARILDDPTFSVLNSLIFFHQVEIVQHLQANVPFLKDLFGVFSHHETDIQRKKDAVLFIQQCCAIAKNLQVAARNQLYSNFIAGGLFSVITFALRHHDAAVRVAGTDVLVALIDHDALMMRGQIFKAINEKTKPLTDTLIELLLIETDLGVKAQMADAIKVLLDPNANSASVETFGRTNHDFLAKLRANAPPGATNAESFIQSFYDESAKKLFQPLKDLENYDNLDDLSVHQVHLYGHLVEVLCFFVKQHAYRSKYFILSEGLPSRVAQLMCSPEKHLKLTALKYFRICIGLHDDFHNRQMVQHNLFEPILKIVFDTMPRDNLLNSACLELFEFIKRDSIKVLINHLVDNYRDKLEKITYVDTFQSLILRYEQLNQPTQELEQSFPTASQESDTSTRVHVANGSRWQGLKDVDAEEEAYYNGSDNEEDELASNALPTPGRSSAENGASPLRPLVNYPDDEEESMEVAVVESSPSPKQSPSSTTPTKHKQRQASDLDKSPTHDATPTAIVPSTPPLERLSEKRRREDDDEDDEFSKLALQSKRRTSSFGSTSSSAGNVIKRKKSFNSGKDGGTGKIAISLAVKGGGDGAERG